MLSMGAIGFSGTRTTMTHVVAESSLCPAATPATPSRWATAMVTPRKATLRGGIALAETAAMEASSLLAMGGVEMVVMAKPC